MAAAIYGNTIYDNGTVDYDTKGLSYNKFYSDQGIS